MSSLNNKILSDITVHMKYAKYIPELNRRETWEELVDRNKQMHIRRYPSLENDIGPCSEVNVRRAGQKLISEKLDINNDIDVKLVGIESREWEDSSMGCKVDSSEEIVDMKIKGFSALFEYMGETFQINTNTDVTMVIECLK